MIQIKKNEMGGACRTMRDRKGGQTWSIETLGRPRCGWEDNIKVDLLEVGWEDVDWIHLV